jgi:hypothetical protein
MIHRGTVVESVSVHNDTLLEQEALNARVAHNYEM